MREVKFRGKRIDNAEWIYGNLIKTFDDRYFIDTRMAYSDDIDMWGTERLTLEVYEVIPETIGQYVGENDGIEIYEEEEQ